MTLAAASTTGTPWWGVPVIAGMFTIVGVALAQVSSYLSDRRYASREKEKREDEHRARWDPDLRAMCAKFAVQLAALHDEAMKRHTGQARLFDTQELEATLAELDFISPAEIYETAHAVFESGVMASVYSQGGGHDTELRWQQYFGALRDGRVAYLQAVRRHFGLPSLDHVELPTSIRSEPMGDSR